MEQRIFDYTPVDPRVHEKAKPRLSRQCRLIGELFVRKRRVCSSELMTIAQRFGARIYDLRKAGWKIDTVERDHATGITWYELKD